MGTIKFASNRWLQLHRRLTTIAQVGFAIVGVASLAAPKMGILSTGSVAVPVIIGLALIHLVYSKFFYKKIQTISSGFATAVMAVIFNLSLLLLIHATGQMHSFLLIGWGASCLLSGMFGLYFAGGTVLMMGVYVALLLTSPAYSQMTIESSTILAGTLLLCVSSWMLWRHLFVDPDNAVIQELTGQLMSKEKQSEIIFQSITDGIIVTNTDGKISFMNPAAATLTQWPMQEATGLNVESVIKLSEGNDTELKPESNPFAKVLADRKPDTHTYQLIARNNEKRTVSLAVSPVVIAKSQQLTGTVAVIRDVTAAYSDEARRADFISTASHEMRTPVAAIEGYLALALNGKVSKIDTKAREYLEKAHASTQHLGNLFQDLLTSAKAEDGRLVNHPKVVEMGEYLEQLTDTLKFSAEKKGLFTNFTLGAGAAEGQVQSNSKIIRPLYYVHVDPDRLREVITNLFDNAVKYTEAGSVAFGLTGDDSVVQFYIRDTGHGIPEQDLPHLFQKFYRVDSSTTRTIGGTGLGLFICRKIVELCNGRIWVTSTLGKGSTFYINLPRLTSQKAQELQRAESESGPGSPT